LPSSRDVICEEHLEVLLAQEYLQVVVLKVSDFLNLSMLDG
jgi:hypothetical protein